VNLFLAIFHLIVRLVERFQSAEEVNWELTSEQEKPQQNVNMSGMYQIDPAGTVSKESRPLRKASSGLQHSNEDFPTLQESLAPSSSTSSNELAVDIPPTEAPTSAASVEQAAPSSSLEPSMEQSKNTLVIKNLPFKFRPVDLDTLLQEHQAKPKNVRLLRDDTGKFTGMAFIRCPSKEEAQRLIIAMDNLDIGGRNIQVEFKLKKKKKNKLGDSTNSLASSDEWSLDQSGERSLGNSMERPLERSMERNLGRSTDRSLERSAERNFFRNQAQAPSTRSKLSTSAEHKITDKHIKPQEPSQLAMQRRKSFSSVEMRNLPRNPQPFVPKDEFSLFSRSVLARNGGESASGIRPVRQPLGPDGKSNGFSEEYRRSRCVASTQK
jgi:RNA recognition motif-containing protein